MKRILILLCLCSTNLFAQIDWLSAPPSAEKMQEVMRQRELYAQLEREGNCEIYLTRYRQFTESAVSDMEDAAIMTLLIAPIFPLAGFLTWFWGVGSTIKATEDAKKFHRKYVRCLVENKDKLTKEERELAEEKQKEIEEEEKAEKELEGLAPFIKGPMGRDAVRKMVLINKLKESSMKHSKKRFGGVI